MDRIFFIPLKNYKKRDKKYGSPRFKEIILLLIFTAILKPVFSMGDFGQSFDYKKEVVINPIDIKKTEAGYFILDYFTGRVLNYNEKFELKRVYSNLIRPSSLSFLDNKIYVSQASENNIAVIDIYSGDRRYYGKTGLRRGEFLHPGQIANNGKYIFVVDEYNYRLQYFDKEMNYIGEMEIPQNSNIKREYNLSFSLELDGDIIYLMDIDNKKLYRYKDYKFEKEIDLKNFINPSAIYKIGENVFVYEKSKKEFVNIKDNSNYTFDRELGKKLVGINNFGTDKNGIIYIEDFKVYYFDFEKGSSSLLTELNVVEKEQYIKPIEIAYYKNEVYILDGEKNKILVYNNYNRFVREIEYKLEKVSSFDIDENGDLVLFSALENSLLKIDNKGKEIKSLTSYEKLPFSYISWLVAIGEYEGIKRGMDINDYEGQLAIDMKDGIYYLANNKDKTIDKFNVKLEKIGSIGGGEGIFNIVFNKKSNKKFSNDNINYNSISDIAYYDGKIYALDSHYNRIYVLNEKGSERYFEDDYDGLNSIYVDADKIVVVDQNNFRLVAYNHEFEKLKEISFAVEGYMPIKIYKNHLIVKEYNKEFRESYKIFNVQNLF